MLTTCFTGTIRQFNLALDNAVAHIDSIQCTDTDSQLLVASAYLEQSMEQERMDAPCDHSIDISEDCSWCRERFYQTEQAYLRDIAENYGF